MQNSFLITLVPAPRHFIQIEWFEGNRNKCSGNNIKHITQFCNKNLDSNAEKIQGARIGQSVLSRGNFNFKGNVSVSRKGALIIDNTVHHLVIENSLS